MLRPGIRDWAQKWTFIEQWRWVIGECLSLSWLQTLHEPSYSLSSQIWIWSAKLKGWRDLLSPKLDTLSRILCKTEQREASLMFREALVISVPFDLHRQKATSFRFENSDSFVYFVLGKPEILRWKALRKYIIIIQLYPRKRKICCLQLKKSRYLFFSLSVHLL